MGNVLIRALSQCESLSTSNYSSDLDNRAPIVILTIGCKKI